MINQQPVSYTHLADWNYTFTNLPKYDAQGNEIVYTVDEQEVNAGDFKFYTKQVAGLNVTNTFTVPNDKIEVQVNKVWDDNSNANGKRPADVYKRQEILRK